MNRTSVSDLNFLSRREINGVVKRLREEGYKKCDGVVRAYTLCTADHLLPSKCREAMEQMNECLRQINNPETLDEAKLKYMKMRRERRERFKACEKRNKDEATKKEAEGMGGKVVTAGAQMGKEE